MSRLALVPINIPARSSAPTYPSLSAGDMYFDTTNQAVYVYTGTSWISTSSSGLPTELDGGQSDSIAPYSGSNPTATATQTFNGGTP